MITRDWTGHATVWYGMVCNNHLSLAEFSQVYFGSVEQQEGVMFIMSPSPGGPQPAMVLPCLRLI